MGLSALGSIFGTFIQLKLKLSEKNWWINSEKRINEIESAQWKISYLTFITTFILLSVWSLLG
jgi:hypothetical protein